MAPRPRSVKICPFLENYAAERIQSTTEGFTSSTLLFKEYKKYLDRSVALVICHFLHLSFDICRLLSFRFSL